MFNKVILVGNLTRDIELRYLQSGTALGSCAIAVTRKFTGSNGQKAEEVCFVDISFWGKTAEIAKQYLRKGSKLLIEGRLKLDQWQNQSGIMQYKHSVVVENMEMLGAQGVMQNNANNYAPNFAQNPQPRPNANQDAYHNAVKQVAGNAPQSAQPNLAQSAQPNLAQSAQPSAHAPAPKADNLGYITPNDDGTIPF
ncbi:single-stranded DNA-binding protein [Campylobacter sp. VBCF_06 NA8]|uniref:single-stranded DNA-binding protein n=1 Tax=Campylobacter sp. VBCF_06 NA8 TaxID=2983822 RepID=UPI003FA44F6E